jgi:virginiamycin B lyase
VARITPDGAVTEFPLPDRTARPHAIVAAGDGCWFTEWGANRVAHIGPTGTVTEHDLPVPRSEPHGLAVGPDGNLYVALETGSVAVMKSAR